MPGKYDPDKTITTTSQNKSYRKKKKKIERKDKWYDTWGMKEEKRGGIGKAR